MKDFLSYPSMFISIDSQHHTHRHGGVFDHGEFNVFIIRMISFEFSPVRHNKSIKWILKIAASQAAGLKT